VSVSPQDDPGGLLRAIGREHALTPYRGSTDDPEPPAGGAVAAVSVILRPKASNPELLLIERAEYESDPWAGHMAFPGGRRNRADDTLLHTAVRETEEETGVDLARYGRQLGRLDPVRPESVRLPAVTILPLVFSVPETTKAVAASAEVERTFWIPISHFLDPSTETVHRLDVDGRILSFPALAVTGGVVWGITRRILRNLLGYRG
jgi:8-oxo-dGTP pyrophosphatase MutT (NUDIX family)